MRLFLGDCPVVKNVEAEQVTAQPFRLFDSVRTLLQNIKSALILSEIMLACQCGPELYGQMSALDFAKARPLDVRDAVDLTTSQPFSTYSGEFCA